MSGVTDVPSVSVVVATRNRLQWLEQCVESVRRQQGVSWELIIVDDCSDEECASGQQTLVGGPVRLLRQPQPMERCVARNRGLEAATGEFIMFLDDDDWLWPGALATLAAALEENPDAMAAVGARWAVFTGEDYERRDAHPRRTMKRNILDELLFGWSAVSGQNLYRCETVHRIGGFEDNSLIPCEDRLLWMRVACCGPVVLVPDTVMSYRYHAGQQRPSNIIEIRDEVVSRVVDDRPAPDRDRLLSLRRSGRLVEQAEEMLSHGSALNGIRTALRAFLAAPGIYFSPLIGEWVVRRLGGRLFRRVFPAKSG